MIWFVLAELTAVALLAGVTGTVRGADLDTLRAYDATSPRRYITKSRYVRQIQRFSIRNGTALHGLRFLVAGDSQAVAGSLRLYGDEGGLIVPRLRVQLTNEITFEKLKSGREWIVVEFEKPITLAGNQFFVELEFADPSLRLISDSRPRVERCMESSSLPRLDQMHVNPGDTSWTETPFGYYVEAYIESPSVQNGLKTDSLFKSLDLPLHQDIQPLSCGDLRGDGYLDLATTSQLFVNDGGRFRTINCDDGLGPSYLFFWDPDGDGFSELAAMRLDTAREIRLFKMLGDELTLLRTIRLPSPCRVRCMIQSDVDRDGILDVVLASQNTAGYDFFVVGTNTDHATRIGGAMEEFGQQLHNLSMSGIDVSHDGTIEILCRSDRGLDVFAIAADGTSALVTRVAFGGSSEFVASANVSSNGLPGNVAVVPSRVQWNELGNHEWSLIHPLLSLVDSTQHAPAFVRQGWWNDKQGALLQTDLDNDGNLDYISFQSGGCGLVRVLSTNPAGYNETTSRWGLDSVTGCTDGICADFDRDGRTDLVLLSGGKPQLFRNTFDGPPSHVFRLRTSGLREGAVLVWSGKAFTYRDHSGRNRLIQDPQTLSLPATSSADNVVVHWPEGRTERFDVHAGVFDHVLQEGDGSSVKDVGDDALNCSAAFEQGKVVIRGLKQGVENTVVVRSVGGVEIAHNKTYEDQLHIEIGEVASGRYLVTVHSGKAICSTMLSIVQ